MATQPSSNWIQNVLGGYGDQFGFRTTSTIRDPQENTRVGGVSNSQHISGTARDYSIIGKSPDQIKEMLSALMSGGFEAFTHDAGSGMHIHAELPPDGDKNVSCPDWMPQTLCGSYSYIAGAVKGSSSANEAVLRMAGLDGAADWFSEYSTRGAFIILGIVMIAIAVYLIFKEPLDKAAMTAAKVLI